MCEECGRRDFEAHGPIVMCLYCGSERLFIGSQPPAVVQYLNQ